MSYGLPYELDNTPWWLHDGRTGMGPWCDPFGYESDVRVLGGVAPAEREKHSWYCRNKADGRYWLTCANGHRGRMRLCYAHAYIIGKRMAGLCPACAFPPQFRDVSETAERLTREWFTMGPGPARVSVGRRIEELRHAMQEMHERGIVQTGAPLVLTEVS